MTPYAKPRFITDPEIIRKILDRCKIIHLGMQEDGHVYVVPTNYGYTYEDGKLTFYSHGAMEGKKWDIIKKNPEICVEIDTGFELVDSEDPCDYGNSYGSIIGTGMATIVEDLEEKKKILNNITRLNAGTVHDFSDAMVRHVNVLKVEVTEFTCKSGVMYEK